MADNKSTFFNTINDHIDKVDVTINRMGDQLSSQSIIDESVNVSIEGTIEGIQREMASRIYADDIISIYTDQTARSAAIVVEEDENRFRVYTKKKESSTIDVIRDLDGVRMNEDGGFTLTRDGRFVATYTVEDIIGSESDDNGEVEVPPSEGGGGQEVPPDTVVSYSISRDGRISYFYADGSCEVSRPFRYEDGVIEYIDCEICGEQVQFKLIEYITTVEHERTYYENPQTEREYSFEIENQYTPMVGTEELENSTSVNVYTGISDHSRVYYENANETSEVNLHVKEIDIPLMPDVGQSVGMSVANKVSHKVGHITAEYPIFWTNTYIHEYPKAPPKPNREPPRGWFGGGWSSGGRWTGGGSWTGGWIGGGWTGGWSGGWIGGGWNDRWKGDRDSEKENKIRYPRPLPPVTGGGAPIKSDPVLRSKDPINLTLSCVTTEEGIMFTYGDRTFILPFQFMDHISMGCDTRNYRVSIEGEFLLIHFCGLTYPLGRVRTGDGEDGIATRFLALDGMELTQVLIHPDGEEEDYVVGDIRFPHIKEAFVSDIQHLTMRSENGDYLITNAYYGLTKNGNLGNFPFFSKTKVGEGQSLITGKYYYHGSDLEDVILEIEVEDDYHERDIWIEENVFKFQFGEELSEIPVQDAERYLGITDIRLQNDSVQMELGYTDVFNSGNITSRIDSVVVNEDTIVFNLKDSVGEGVFSVELDHGLDIDSLDGDNGVFIDDAHIDDGQLIITGSDNVPYFDDRVDAHIPHEIITEFRNIEDRKDRLSITTFKSHWEDIELYQRNIYQTEYFGVGSLFRYTTAFRGDYGDIVVSITPHRPGEDILADTRYGMYRRNERFGYRVFTTDRNSYTIGDYDIYGTPVVIEADYNANRIRLRDNDGRVRGNTHFYLTGIDGEYLTEVIEENDNLYYKTNVDTDYRSLGRIENFHGDEGRYINDTIYIEGDAMLFPLTSGMISVDISSISANRGDLIEEISHTDSNVKVKTSTGRYVIDHDIAINPPNATLIDTISVDDDGNARVSLDNGVGYDTTHRMEGFDAKAPSLATIGNRSISFHGDKRYEVDLSRHYDGLDGVYVSSITYDIDGQTTQIALVGDNNKTISTPINGAGTSHVNTIELHNGVLRYRVEGSENYTTFATGLGRLDGIDGRYIEELYVNENRSLKLRYSDSEDVATLLSSIDGRDSIYNINDIVLDDDKIKVYGDNQDIESPRTQYLLHDLVYDDKVLIVDANYDVTVDVGDTDGKDFDDGRWFTNLFIKKGDVTVEWSDDTTEVVKSVESYEITDVFIDEDGMLNITEERGNDYISNRNIVAPEPERKLERVEVSDDYHLLIHYDDGSHDDVGHLRGEVNANHITGATITDGKLYLVRNNAEMLGGDDIITNFGFAPYEPKFYDYGDSVIFEGSLYVSLVNNNGDFPSDDSEVWGRISMSDEDINATFAPRIISPSGLNISSDRPEFVAGNVNTLYYNPILVERQFQIEREGRNWSIPVYDVVVSEMSMIPDIRLEAGVTYKWRCRDRIHGLEQFSVWSEVGTFRLADSLVETPQLELEDNGDNHNVVFSVSEYTGSKELETIEFDYQVDEMYGDRKRDTYEIEVKCRYVFSDDSTSEWSNIITYSVSETPILDAFDPIIEVDSTTGYLEAKVVNPITGGYYNPRTVSSQWEIVHLSSNTTQTLKGFHLNEVLSISELIDGDDYSIRMRYFNSDGYSMWSNMEVFTYTHTSSSVEINLIQELSNSRIYYDLYLSYDPVPIHDHVNTIWEVIDASNGDVLEVNDNLDNHLVYNLDVSDYINMDLVIKTTVVRSLNADMIETLSLSIPRDISYNEPPTIVDYFVHDFGLTIISGVYSKPSKVEYNVWSPAIGSIPSYNEYFETNTIHDPLLGEEVARRSILVRHTEFTASRLYFMRARQYHDELGWSDWSNTEVFGYDMKTSGSGSIIVPSQVSKASVLTVSGGAGARYYYVTAGIYEYRRTFMGGNGGTVRFVTDTNINSHIVGYSIGSGGQTVRSASSVGVHDRISGSNSHISGMTSTDGDFTVDGVQSKKYTGTLLRQYYPGAHDAVSSSSGSYYRSSPSVTHPSIAEVHQGIGLLGGTTSNPMGDMYPSIPVVGRGSGRSSSDSGGVALLYGILKYPLGFGAPWQHYEDL